jgi:hypothetical protein
MTVFDELVRTCQTFVARRCATRPEAEDRTWVIDLSRDRLQAINRPPMTRRQTLRRDRISCEICRSDLWNDAFVRPQ